MNMAKLGTVSAAMQPPAKTTKPNIIKAYGLIPYTLCVFQIDSSRNGCRHSFAFYERLISGRALSICRTVGMFGFSVIPVQTPVERTPKTTPKSAQSLVGIGFQAKSTRKNTVPPFVYLFNGFAACFSGGCHE
jgi:hypothetical protein